MSLDRLLAQIPPVVPVLAQVVTSGDTGGDWHNPNNWSSLVGTLGIPAVLALVLLFVCGLLLWQILKQRNQPTNANQVKLLKMLFKASERRHKQTVDAFRGFCDIAEAFAKTVELNINQELKDIRKELSHSASSSEDLADLATDDEEPHNHKSA